MKNNLLPEDFREFIHQLNDKQVKYLIIGGYAMGVYGHIRATKDLDIFIDTSDENVLKLKQACIAFQIPEEQISLRMFQIPQIVDIGDEPFKIEILKKLDVIDFNYAYERRNIIYIENLELSIASIDDMIHLKEAAIKERNESRDQEDLGFLKKKKREN
ncbi:MAG: hypothetical protein ACNS60_08210 [Candidatus Cyclobacteriaceae bacterium M2_1C_046]